MPRKRLSLHALGAQLRGTVSAGAEWRGEIVEDGLVAEITVRIRRLVERDERQEHHAAALAALHKETWRILHCCARVGRRRWWGKSQGTCDGRVVAVVVFRSPAMKAPAYEFVCSRHRKTQGGINPPYVLAVVDLREVDLEPIRRKAEVDERARQEAYRAKWEAEDRAADLARAERAKGGA